MKNKIQQLVKVGLSKELLKNLSEGQINQLHNRMISEQVNVSKSDTTMINKLKSEKKPFQVYEKEIDEDDTVDKDPFELSSTQDKRQVGPSSYGDNPTVDKEMDSDDADGMGMMEIEIGEGKKKKSKYNPWAICTSSVGREDNDKFERCVKDVKRNVREGKNPHQVIVEMALEKMVEKHISPRMTKGDLIKTLSEQGIIRRPMSNMRIGFVDEGMDKPTKKSYSSKKEDMEQQTKEAPTRVKPGTKEKEKPGKMDPFKNPKHQPKPKAKKDIEEQATKTAPPVVKPGTKEKPKTSDPFKNPKHQPKPKASTKAPKMGTVEIPDYLTFDQLKINFKDQ
jgi:hypothetical protein